MKKAEDTSILSREASKNARGEATADASVGQPNGTINPPFVGGVIKRGEKEQHEEHARWAERDGALAAQQIAAADEHRKYLQDSALDDTPISRGHAPWLVRNGFFRAVILALAVAALTGLVRPAVGSVIDVIGLRWVLSGVVAAVMVTGAFLEGGLLRQLHSLTEGENRRRRAPVAIALGALLIGAAVALGAGASFGHQVTVTVLVLLLLGVVAGIGFADRPRTEQEHAEERAHDALLTYIRLGEERRGLWLSATARTRAIRGRVPELQAEYYARNLQVRRHGITPELREQAARLETLGDEPEWLNEAPDFDPVSLTKPPASEPTNLRSVA